MACGRVYKLQVKLFKYMFLTYHLSTPKDQTIVTNILFIELLSSNINSYFKVKRHLNFPIGNSQYKLRQKSKFQKVIKHTFKLLPLVLDFEVAIALIQKAPNAVTDAILTKLWTPARALWQFFCIEASIYNIITTSTRWLIKKSIFSKGHLIRKKGGAVLIIVLLYSTVLKLIN